ncbi:YqcC family protein [Halotalea alkalilenta]|uniref:YqcC-like domain-containing protein n=1 Tax=Halotalea alkalilenta TaxID=376489 RepID=A0A172YE09_9GAMM|nr:YqcC family protein [Halotalea alkalilenta]ANF57447.1 hypothetical protein A5892_08190 [Halotalea alkalilenta]
MNQRTRLSDALTRLEAAMRAADIWGQPTPSPQAFASLEPFALDSMEMAQWLRFVFVARLRTMLASAQPLPQGSSVAAAAEVYLPQMSMGARLPVIEVLREIDLILNDEDGTPALH